MASDLPTEVDFSAYIKQTSVFMMKYFKHPEGYSEWFGDRTLNQFFPRHGWLSQHGNWPFSQVCHVKQQVFFCVYGRYVFWLFQYSVLLVCLSILIPILCSFIMLTLGGRLFIFIRECFGYFDFCLF